MNTRCRPLPGLVLFCFIALQNVLCCAGQTIEFTRVQALTNGEIALTISVPPGQRAYRLEVATNALDWSPLFTFATNLLTSQVHTDSAAPFLDGRLYRALQLGGTHIIGGDHIRTDDGELIIYPRTHASFVMQWNGLMIYNDPDSPTSLYTGLPRADLILISHEHGDHFDAAAISAVKTTNTIIIAPQAVYSQSGMLPHRPQTIVLTNGASASVLGLQVEAVPAYNIPPSQIYHAFGNGNGYVVTIGGKRIYISGDTQDVPEMRALQNIDIAFVAMNLPFTMTVDAAASAVREFKPRIVYPYHYSNSDVERFKRIVGTDLGIEVRLRKWY